MRNLARLQSKCFFPILIVAWLLVLPSLGEAQMFRYVDKDGVLHFTNVPTLPNQVKTPTLPPYAANLINKMRSPTPGTLYMRPSAIPSCNPLNQVLFDPYIKFACQRYGLDYNFVKAVIRTESAFDPGAVSPKGAMGLMQLMPGTSRDLGVINPFDPNENIDAGVRYLRFLLDRFYNNIVLALAAYNAGPEAVEKHGGVPPYEETRNYVERVLDIYVRSMR
jgi:soluble lytic murein transglycosylase-like protein